MFINTQMTPKLHEVCSKSKIIPVVIIEDADKAVAVAQALQKGGIEVIEVTLRTPAALQAIENIASSVEGMHVGAGTLLNPRSVYKAKKAGAHFGVSPGTTSSLLDASYDCLLPMLPGVSSVSELLMWLDYGIDFFKFFPAEASGGCNFLSSLASPLPNVRFCPTGGITPETAKEYLSLPNVSCVGGSWLTPVEAINNNDWDAITELAQLATQI